MEGELINWVVSALGGGVGGNIAGVLLRNKSLGPILNSILGAAGGALGGQLLPQLIPQLLELLQGSGLAGNAGLSAVLGALLPIIGGLLKPGGAKN